MADLGKFSEHLRARMLAQASLLATLTTHPTLIGQGREQAFAELLRQFIPRRFEVLSGTIMPGDPPEPSSRQVDIMVADTIDYPTILRSGELAVVLPEAVRALVEVKSNLRLAPQRPKFLANVGPINRAAGNDDGQAGIGDRQGDDAAEAEDDGDEDELRGVEAGEDDDEEDDDEEEGGNAHEQQAGARARVAGPNDEKKEPENFLDALVQIGKLAAVVDSGSAVFTALLSYDKPKRNATLRRYLATCIGLRDESLGRLTAAPEDRGRFAEFAAAISAANLPTMIVINDGAIALKQPPRADGATVYRFYKAAPNVPSVVSLVEQLVTRVTPDTTVAAGADDARRAAAKRVETAFRKATSLIGTSLLPDAACADLDVSDPAPPGEAEAQEEGD